MKADPAMAMISLASKAGKVKSGEFSVEKAIENGKARLVIVAKDASFATKKSYRDHCGFYGVKCCEYSDKENLGYMIGKDYRAAIAVCDDNFARGIAGRIKESAW